MRTSTKKLRLITAALCAVLCIAWLSLGTPDVSGKGKPGGDGGGAGGPGQNGGGVIYFSYDNKLYTMNDDGSGITQVTGFPRAPWGEPSRDKHAAKRWIIQRQFVQGEIGPDGYQRQEFVALSDSGNEVPLHIAPDLDPLEGGRWYVGDEYISWVGRRWDNDPMSPTFGDILEGGLYVTELAFDEQGNITGLGSPSVLLVPFALVEDVDGVYPDIGGHDWSPDGSAFVFTTISGRELVIADLITEMCYTVLDGGMVPRYQQPPRWSPAGDKFLIRYNDSKQKAGVWVVNIDGSGLKMLEGYRISTQPVVGVWSPTGSHLLYQHFDHLREDTYIVRAKEDGRGNTRITDRSIGAGSWAPYPLGWRE